MDTILPASKRNSKKSSSNRPSNVAEDRQIVNHAASLRQLIQQHVTNFYRTDGPINPDQNPFGFEPATSRCMEVALRRYIATEIVDFINQYIKSGIEEKEISTRHSNLADSLGRFKYGTADEQKRRAHLLVLFGSGRSLAEMLASGQGWKFGDWDTMVERSTEASQMQLLVFPALFKRGEHIGGELGNGQKQQPSRSHTTTSETWSEGRRTTTQQGRGKKLTYEISEKELSWGSRCAQRIDSAEDRPHANSHSPIMGFILLVFRGLGSALKRLRSRGDTRRGV